MKPEQFELRGYALWQLVMDEPNGQRWRIVVPDVREFISVEAREQALYLARMAGDCEHAAVVASWAGDRKDEELNVAVAKRRIARARALLYLPPVSEGGP